MRSLIFKYTRECLICNERTAAAGFLFCGLHWAEYKDRLDEPWYKGIRNEIRRQDNSDAKYDHMKSVSINHYEAGEGTGYCEECSIHSGVEE